MFYILVLEQHIFLFILFFYSILHHYTNFSYFESLNRILMNCNKIKNDDFIYYNTNQLKHLKLIKSLLVLDIFLMFHNYIIIY